jgi:hypothetical protein
MITAKMESSGGKTMLLVGLSRESITHLKEGKSLHISGPDLGLENDVVVIYEETEDLLYNALKPYMGVSSQLESNTSQTIQ